MLAPPEDLPETDLAATLWRSWGISVESMAYRAAGWGSHHWEVTGAGWSRWWVTVDELAQKRCAEGEPLTAGLRRLRASLAAARALRDGGATFVVAPLPAGDDRGDRDGRLAVRLGDRFAVAVYPFVAGQSYRWGEFASPEHRRAVLDLVTEVHRAPAGVSSLALPDDFTVPYLAELTAACDPGGDLPDCGPYARPAAELLRRNAASVGRLLARYDDLVRQARDQPGRAVLTHGEPHPANTMLTEAGWVLIDWDTVLVAPPERDLWLLDAGDGQMLDAYADATGVSAVPMLLDLYRLRWELTDLAIDVARFRRPHAGNADDDKTWQLLRDRLGG